MNYLSTITKDVLGILFDHCDVIGLIRLGSTCKRLYGMICNEEMYQKRSLVLWEEMFPKTSSELIKIKEKAMKEMKWKRMMKCLSNVNGKGYACRVADGVKIILGKYDKEGKLSANGVMLFLKDGISAFVGDYRVTGNGMGAIYFSEGDEFHGNFENFVEHGNGEYRWTDGRKHVGMYHEGEMTGFGSEYWPDGNYYVGDFKRDEFHGHGVFNWPDGFRYDGNWKRSQPINPAECVHPTVKQCEEEGFCTRSITDGDLPQIIFNCVNCKFDFCQRCHQDQECHPCKDPRMRQEWLYGFCDCKGKECEKERQAKRRKIE
eukprot:TRINITY_DN9552_c0_g1_i1.p1 TRINITY_DN9552_c0_g1~~TRINITY_DN9552_c0_g1_i1.p1  ORF type:complete len:342 (-),score=67.30 TRINITY_DN9552_c0_g1_i1:20-973(-)